MYKKTKAIVLYATKYPKGYIVHFYTREFGRLSCVINDVKSRHSPFRKVFLQPLSLVEVVFSIDSNSKLPRLRESVSSCVYSSIPYDFCKNTVAMFLAEFLSKVLREEQSDAVLFDFVESSLLFFDTENLSLANFHIVFLLQLTYLLGIAPNLENSNRAYFDMLESRFTANKPLHNYFLEESEKFALLQLMRMNYRNMGKFSFSHTDRVKILVRIIEYYQIHLGNFGTLRSLEVLQEVFS